jgi:hypothetical protein
MITRVAQQFWLLFPARKKLFIDFDKKKTVWATRWAIFFTNSSGHTAREATKNEKNMISFFFRLNSIHC